MIDLVGRKCRIILTDSLNNKTSFYTAKEILGITNTHIFFIDKYEKEMAVRLADIIKMEML